MSRNTFRSVAHVAMLVAALASCAGSDNAGPGPTNNQATLAVNANLSGTGAVTVVVNVTAADIPSMLVFNIPVVNGIATGTITIPAGSNRTIALRAYDAGGVETHSGSTTVNIAAGANGTMSITLTPLTGDLPITATLGSYVVTVSPTSATLNLAGTTTVQLTATIKDSQNNPVNGVVSWATNDPGVATVNASGLVTATAVGTTTISAVYQGVAGTSTITVAP